MFDFSKLFSYKKDEINITYRFLGIKYSRKNMELTQKFIIEQDKYDLSEIKNAKELIVLFIPNIKMITGGIQSIYSICKYSREICPNAVCVISTIPGKYTYSHNNLFKNDEKIYRWEQIANNIHNAKKVILHVPEYCSGKFYKSLKKDEIEALKGIDDLQVNILNQNIELMPEPKKLKDLYKLTDNITQTIGHHRYATQEVCDKWQMPTHFLSVHIDISSYKSYPFEEKEKIIVLSPDEAPYKQVIVEKLKKELPEFKLVTVENMSFDEYMDLIAKSYFTITFGEGMDGYFLQPVSVGSIGLAVYNERFFPDESWKEFDNVFATREEIIENITVYCKNLYTNKNKYYSVIHELVEKCHQIYSFNNYKDNLKQLYSKNYNFTPLKEREKYVK